MKHPDSFWQRYRYYLSGIVLLFPLWYFYQALHPQFPAPWPSQQLGPFTIAPMPLNLKPPYIHHDQYLKDFYLAFQQGDVAQIRQGYVNLGPEALPLGATATSRRRHITWQPAWSACSCDSARDSG